MDQEGHPQGGRCALSSPSSAVRKSIPTAYQNFCMCAPEYCVPSHSLPLDPTAIHSQKYQRYTWYLRVSISHFVHVRLLINKSLALEIVVLNRRNAKCGLRSGVRPTRSNLYAELVESYSAEDQG